MENKLRKIVYEQYKDILKEGKVGKCQQVAPEMDDQAVLNGFKWHRFILDEAHEMLEQVHPHLFQSTYRWYISASPFPNRPSIARCADFEIK
eukprot:UN09050